MRIPGRQLLTASHQPVRFSPAGTSWGWTLRDLFEVLNGRILLLFVLLVRKMEQKRVRSENHSSLGDYFGGRECLEHCQDRF